MCGDSNICFSSFFYFFFCFSNLFTIWVNKWPNTQNIWENVNHIIWKSITLLGSINLCEIITIEMWKICLTRITQFVVHNAKPHIAITYIHTNIFWWQKMRIKKQNRQNKAEQMRMHVWAVKRRKRTKWPCKLML